MKKAVSLLALFVLIFVAGCVSREAQKPAPSGKAPDFEIKDINGRNVKLSDYAGSVILLNFFATWCPPCRAEMPDFNEIAAEYRGRVTIIAVNVGNESLRKVQGFVNSNRLGFTVALDDGNVSNLYGPIRAIPVSVLIDRNFNIAKRYIGARTKDVFVTDIEALLLHTSR